MTEPPVGAAGPTGTDRGPWVAHQSWRELLFAHWPVPKRALAERLPAGVELDLWQGGAWVGVVPFRLVGLRPRFLPGVPGATDFPELNVRTYVRVGGVPGVYFFSLDAASALAVTGARALFGLPYFHADMECRREGGWVRYRSRRREAPADAPGPTAAFEARYRPTGFPAPAEPGSLEAFLVERYRLFVVRGGAASRVEIEHAPWPLRPAAAEIEVNTMALAAGIELPDQPPMVHYVDRQDVLTGPPLPARG